MLCNSTSLGLTFKSPNAFRTDVMRFVLVEPSFVQPFPQISLPARINVAMIELHTLMMKKKEK
jgi:hypothetical protein